MITLYRKKSWLEQHYITLGWSQQEIAEFCGVSQATVSKWIIKHNIESRSFSEGKFGKRNGSWVDSPYRDSSLLYKLYIVERLSISQIAKQSGHSNRTIQRWLQDVGIPTRTGSSKFSSREGENNSNWKGGVDLSCPSCGKEKSRKSKQCSSCYHDFRRTKYEDQKKNNDLVVPVSKLLRLLISPWKQQVLERDNFQCVSCGDTSKLYAHHIVPFFVIRDQLIMEVGSVIDFDFSTSENRQLFIDKVKNDPRLWDIDNGVTLCTDCHRGEHRRLKSQMDDALYTYNATVLDNYDGDTLTVSIDLGFGLTKEAEIRLFGVNTPELKSSDIHKRGKAIAAKNAIGQLCQPGKHIIIRTYKSGKYGRWLGMLMLQQGIVNDFLLETNLAEPYIL